jgi:hypothetical protein
MAGATEHISPPLTVAVAAARTRTERLPWVVWTVVAATVSAVVGDVWDISWHISVGRDTFWTPPHVLVQLCAAIGGLTSLYLVLRTTFGADERERAASVRVFGLRAPFGAFVSGWGALAMIFSAAFDNWWHEAYGLDVKVISPPHTVLILGGFAVIFGGFLMVIAHLNRASLDLAAPLETLLVFLVGALMVSSHANLIEFSNRLLMHSAVFYRWFAIPFPALLALLRRIARRRWACTQAAAVYTVLSLAQEWLLPLFPAEQKLAPVFQRVPYMVPLGFPVLVIVPALLLDIAWPRVQGMTGWRQAAALGALFLGGFIAVQWPFAEFLLSRRAHNWVFGSHYTMYLMAPGSPLTRDVFFAYERSAAAFWGGMIAAAVIATASSGVALAVGGWARRLQR